MADYHLAWGPEWSVGTGLLGASIPTGLGGSFSPDELRNARLLEIERRIIAIEKHFEEIGMPIKLPAGD